MKTEPGMYLIHFFSKTLTLISFHIYHSKIHLSIHNIPACLFGKDMAALYTAGVWCVVLKVTYGVNELCCTGHMSSLV